MERRQIDVTVTDSVANALTAWRAAIESGTPYTVAIVDRMMPHRDGFDLIEAIRKQLEGYSISTVTPAFIMLTSSNQASDLAKVRELGVSLYLQKPVLQSELIEAIRKSMLRSVMEKSETPKASNDVTHRKLSLLLAEDGEVNRAVMVELFKRAGHDVSVVEDGAAAVEAWKREKFDAIFMDIQMPLMDGIEATMKIRQLEKEGEHIPIIAISAAAMKSDEEKSFAAGMDDHISKPIDFARLRRLLITLESNNGNAIQANRERIVDFDTPFDLLPCPPDQQILLVQTLRRETIQRLDEIENGIHTVDFRLMLRAAHSLKGAAGLFNAEQVTEPALAIEQAAREGNIETVKAHFSGLSEAGQLMLAEINEWLELHQATTL